MLFDFTSFGKNLFLCFTGSRQHVVGYAPVNKAGCCGHIVETPDFGYARQVFEQEIAKLMDEKAGWTPPWFAEAVKSGRAKRYIADPPYGIGRDWEKRDWRSRANAVFIDKDGKEIEWDRFSKLAATRRA